MRLTNFFIAALLILSFAAFFIVKRNEKPCIAWEEQEVVTYPNIVFMNEHPILAFTPVVTKQQVCTKRQTQ